MGGLRTGVFSKGGLGYKFRLEWGQGLRAQHVCLSLCCRETLFISWRVPEEGFKFKKQGEPNLHVDEKIIQKCFSFRLCRVCCSLLQTVFYEPKNIHSLNPISMLLNICLFKFAGLMNLFSQLEKKNNIWMHFFRSPWTTPQNCCFTTTTIFPR